MTAFQRIPAATLARITDVDHERNMYAHPNPIARAIFWQRLAVGYALLKRFAPRDSTVLDFGGGSGAFLPTLANHFREVSVIDMDIDDARRVASHYALAGVHIHECDVTCWTENNIYDVVVAMDVLEHFADSSVPGDFLKKHLRRGGLLLVSLPTENWIYRMGRLVLRKSKPADHYHPATTLVRYYVEHGYSPLATRYVPHIGPLAVPLFHIGVFRKTD